MKVKLTNWFTLALFIGIISEVYLVSPPHRVSCGGKSKCDKPTKCPGKLVCPPGEVLVDSPPCCEPTCCDDCSHKKCPLIYVYKPTCVCKPGLVRYNGVCIEPCECPSQYEESEPPSPTPKCDDIPYQDKLGCQTCNSLPKEPPCGCPQTAPQPCGCPQTAPRPCGCPQTAPRPCPCKETPPSCPCQGSALPCSCYPPPPVAPPNPCGACCKTV